MVDAIGPSICTDELVLLRWLRGRVATCARSQGAASSPSQCHGAAVAV